MLVSSGGHNFDVAWSANGVPPFNIDCNQCTDRTNGVPPLNIDCNQCADITDEQITNLAIKTDASSFVSLREMITTNVR